MIDVSSRRRTTSLASWTFRRWEALAVALLAAATVSLVIGVTVHHQPDRPSPQAATAPIGPTHTATSVLGTTGADPTDTPTPTSSRSVGTTGRRTPHTTGRTTRALTSKPRPPAAPTSTATTTPAARTSLPPGDGSAVMATSDPVHLDVPAIGVSSDMPRLGLNSDGTIEVPPLAANSQAGWYRFSATPGAVGSAVVLGHIDSAAYGPGVFYHLGDLRPGDEIVVTRADGSKAVFRTDRVAEYPKTAFPTGLVYTPTSYPSLRLITCGGAFDAQDHNYLDNIIVFATLVDTHT